MQLSAKKSIRSAVATLTAALVGSQIGGGVSAGQSETSLLIYSEKDRARATEFNFSLTKELKRNYTLDLRLTYDGLTGATPTGRSPSRNEQTVTRASGGKTVLVPAGVFPTDASFTDRRFAGELSLSRPLSASLTGQAGLQFSSEYDYKSLGISGGLVNEFFATQTSLGVSFAYMRDKINPVGGLPDPFAVIDEDNDEDPNFDGEKKRVFDAVFSLTQVLDQRSLLRLSYSYDRASGYLTDPYKVISEVQPATNAEPGEPVRDLWEKRPDGRTKHAVYTELKRFMFGSAVGAAYRYFWDDWGITAHAVDVNFTVNLKRRGSLQPRVRWYNQSRADFYRVFLIDGQSLPQYASADSRLAAFAAYTYGLTYTLPVKDNAKLKLTVEYYLQRGDSSPPEKMAAQEGIDLFPRLDAVMLRLGYVRSF